MKLLAALTLTALFAIPAQEDLVVVEAAGTQHEWLQQFTGKWAVKSEVTAQPGVAPMRWESEETVRSIGDLWIVGEQTMDMGGSAFSSMLTLGYDPAQKHFVGSWVDSMQTRMWTYTGELDDAKRVLTLSAKGPSMMNPTKMANYRDTYEHVDKDHKRMTSSIQGEDDEWTTYMVMEATRIKD